MFDFDVITGPGPRAALAAKPAQARPNRSAPTQPATADAAGTISPAEPDQAARPPHS